MALLRMVMHGKCWRWSGNFNSYRRERFAYVAPVTNHALRPGFVVNLIRYYAMNRNFTRFAFTKSVKKAQEHYGTRKAYARMEKSGDRYLLTDRETAFIESRDSFYMATVGENGWPYVQYRRGPKGFLKVMDETTIGYADFRGNGQYISTGNLQSSNRASLILVDYPSQQRLKIWTESRITGTEEDVELFQQLALHESTHISKGW